MRCGSGGIGTACPAVDVPVRRAAAPWLCMGCMCTHHTRHGEHAAAVTRIAYTIPAYVFSTNIHRYGTPKPFVDTFSPSRGGGESAFGILEWGG